MKKIKLFLITCLSSGIIIVFLIVSPGNHFKIKGYLRKQSQPTFLNRHYYNKNWDKFCKVYQRKEGLNTNSFYYYKKKNLKLNPTHPSNQVGLLWCKVPKAGSTTLTRLFLRLAGAKVEDPKSGNSTATKVHKLLRNYYERLSRHQVHNLTRSGSGAPLKFLVVRDPFERILSAYRDKLEDYQRDLKYRDGYYYQNYGRLMVPSKENSSRVPTWEEFISYLIRTVPSRYDEHWMPISRLCSPCTIQYDYVIKLDNFEKQIQFPLRKVGIHAPDIGWSHRTGSSNLVTIQNYYNKLRLSDLKKLYLKYKSDFDLFGYNPYKYFRLAVT